MTKNVGTLDRIIRVISGLALLAAFFLNPEASMRLLYLIGIIPLVTGLMGNCGLYSLIGVSTCPIKK
ncbi:DUF2892 domain-containing protein [Amylibacter sp. SFDW26]|uniref:YgaP family membrane protein n=1 Tax=Amylibacter sp. SFDW26 TaxID=2652722 RepID=UPI001261CFB3|nr:DUF2892 domain-containing protein [Amylibacter sp. SFDW26]KAB7615911.1 DUF2892 domain-containing protein [Amylibacter sp. SFDW26]